MRRRRRRPMFFTAHCLRDGTVLGAYPVRKPSARILKRDHEVIDEENICREFVTSGMNLSDVRNETRTRFQDIISNALNVRRTFRALVFPRLDALQLEIAALRCQLDRIEHALAAQRAEIVDPLQELTPSPKDLSSEPDTR